MEFDNKNDSLHTVLAVETGRSHDTVSPTRSIQHEEVNIDLLLISYLSSGARRGTIYPFVGNPALLRRYLPGLASSSEIAVFPFSSV